MFYSTSFPPPLNPLSYPPLCLPFPPLSYSQQSLQGCNSDPFSIPPQNCILSGREKKEEKKWVGGGKRGERENGGLSPPLFPPSVASAVAAVGGKAGKEGRAQRIFLCLSCPLPPNSTFLLLSSPPPFFQESIKRFLPFLLLSFVLLTVRSRPCCGRGEIKEDRRRRRAKKHFLDLIPFTWHPLTFCS